MPVDTAPRQVRIAQEGEMWLKPGGRAMRFAATQSFATERVAFWWRARFPIAGPIALSVIDEYADEDGQLAVHLLGVPLQRQRGPETVAGEALRYLAELPLAPPPSFTTAGSNGASSTKSRQRCRPRSWASGSGSRPRSTAKETSSTPRPRCAGSSSAGNGCRRRGVGGSATTKRSVPGAFRRQARPTGSCRKVATSTGAPELSQLQASISRSETAAHGES